MASSDPRADTAAGPAASRRSAQATRRQQRRQQILSATRDLFDERGVRDAQIEDIASAVGINRAIVYRHFTGKEELFAMTLVGYLDELAEALAGARGKQQRAPEQLVALVDAFVEYSVAHPAFVDCAQTLMGRTWPELFEELSEGALYRLGRAITGCLHCLVEVLEEGAREGDFGVQDPTLVAHTLYASGLGTLQLARVGILVHETAPGVPTVARLTPDQVRAQMRASALALAEHTEHAPH